MIKKGDQNIGFEWINNYRITKWITIIWTNKTISKKTIKRIKKRINKITIKWIKIE